MCLDPPVELYPDPPPAYEEYFRKTAGDKGAYPTETIQQPIQEQPHTIRVWYDSYITNINSSLHIHI